MQDAVININGQIFTPGQTAGISVFDRGFLYGDSLYEVARTYGDRFFKLDEHLKRLEASSHLCQMKLGQTLAHYEAEIYKTLRVFRSQKGMEKTEAYGRIIVTRGVGKIGFGLSCVQTPTQYVIIIQPLEPPTEAQFQKGLKLKISARLRNDPRALDPAMKSGNYLNSLLAYLDAADEGFDDALLCNYDGHLTEGTTFNLFYVRRGILATPPLDIGILDGITRRLLIESAKRIGIEVREVRFPRARLYEADEVFLTSSIKEVFPITQIDSHRIGSGKPGPMTVKLRKEFAREISRVSS